MRHLIALLSRSAPPRLRRLADATIRFVDHQFHRRAGI